MDEQLQKLAALQKEAAALYTSAQKLADLIKRGKGGREVSLAITKIQEAQSWLLIADRLLENEMWHS